MSDPRVSSEFPSVSVIVATRDRPEMLRECLESIAAQDYPGPIETIVVFDQTPPDESLAVREGNRTVRVVANDRTPGLPGARNSGAERAAGEFLSFCDDDDLFLPPKTRRQVEALRADPAAEGVVCGIEVVHKDAAPVARPIELDALTLEDLLADRVMQALFQTTMIRRPLYFDGIGPDDEDIPGGYAEDYEWLLRAARRRPLLVVPDPLVVIRWSGGSWFANRWQTIIDALTLVLERNPEWGWAKSGRVRRGHARVLGQQAFAEAALGRRGAALRLAARTVRRDPRQPRAWLAGAVAAGLVSADRVVRMLNERGRGI